MVKKQGAKRRPWNKGLEVGKKGAFTPAQVKRIRQVLMAHGASGLRDLALFQGGDRHHAAWVGPIQSHSQGSSASQR
jgi:hypothetical protein